MKSKVSIIIPNYNSEEYILKCINSILIQTYENIEIIIIDDGSTDKSWSIIKSIIDENDNIIAIKQPNLNASIARNKGIDLASGKYILFLDSDDELFKDSIENLVMEMEHNNIDMVIGNFIDIDINNHIIGQHKEVDDTYICKNPLECIGMTPNPSNKFFKLDIIKNNSIYFGNVRIGQDLNFYLKYILYCKKIKLINKNIYKWRKVSTSMTNSYNLRIFDIFENFKDIKAFYLKTGNIKLYDDYIKIIEFRHYYLQMEKQKYFENKKVRNSIVDLFDVKLNELDVRGCIIFSKYKNDYMKCKFKLFFKKVYTTRLYKFIDKNFARRG